MAKCAIFTDEYSPFYHLRDVSASPDGLDPIVDIPADKQKWIMETFRELHYVQEYLCALRKQYWDTVKE